MGLHLVLVWNYSKKVELFCHHCYKLTQMCESFSAAFSVVVTDITQTLRITEVEVERSTCL
jgi:hypothetical protein